MVDETVDNQPPEEQEAANTEPQAEQPEPSEQAAEAEPSEAASAVAGLTLGGGAPADEDEVPQVAPVIRGKVDRSGIAIGTGRRKTSVARVRIQDGTGQLTINGRNRDDYFKTDQDRQSVVAPLNAVDVAGTVDVWVRVKGGGTTGQAGAIVLGIARALEARNPALHATLSSGGYLTRDSRMVERKKYGYKKARKSFQFSKR